MSAYSLWQMPWMAFFSKPLYQETGLRGKGGNGLYLLLLLAVCLIPGVVNFNHELRAFASQEAPKLIEQIPEITIMQGQAAMAAPQPYEIRDPETREAWILIDTRDAALKEPATSDARLILTRTQLIFHKSKYETRVFELSNISSLVLNQQVLWKWLRIFLTGIAYLSYPSALVFFYTIKLLQALFFAVIGLLLCEWLKANPLSFGGVFRITILALTPALLLKTVLGLFHISVPAAGWIYFCLTVGYLSFGIYAVAQEQKATDAGLNQPAPMPVPVPVLELNPASAGVQRPQTKPAEVRKKTVRKILKAVKKARTAVRKKSTTQRVPARK